MTLNDAIKRTLAEKQAEQHESQWPEHMTTPVLAEYLGRPVATIRTWLSRGKAPKSIKIDPTCKQSARLFRKSDVDRWLADREAQS